MGKMSRIFSKWICINSRTIFNAAKVILKNTKYATNDKILKEREIVSFSFRKGLNYLVLGKLRLWKNRALRTSSEQIICIKRGK